MSGLVAAASLKEFFKALVTEAVTRQRIEITPVTEFYLVNLLSEFAAADRLFTQRLEGKQDHEPLAVLYHQAQQRQREEKIRLLRRLGDLSLYKVGFFQEALREQPVGPEYYIQMGGAAYGQVADLAPAAGFADVYRELCAKFRALVDVLEEIAARGLTSTGPSGVLRVYESWARNGSENLERVLVDAGVLPKGMVN